MYIPRKALGNTDRLRRPCHYEGQRRPTVGEPPSGLPLVGQRSRPWAVMLVGEIRRIRLATHLWLGCYVVTELDSVALHHHEQPHQSPFSIVCVVYSACDGALPLLLSACLARPHWSSPRDAVRLRAPASFVPRACTPPSKRINLLGEFTTKIFNLTSH